MKISEFIGKSLAENTGYVEQAIKDLSKDELAWRVAPQSNSIIFLMWHMARVEDLIINGALLTGKELYEANGWYSKFGTPAEDNGFRYDLQKLDAWPVPELDLVKSYTAEVRRKTLEFLKTLDEEKLDGPRRKGTLGTALSHMVTELGEHAGQVGYIRGILKGIENPPLNPPQPGK